MLLCAKEASQGNFDVFLESVGVAPARAAAAIKVNHEYSRERIRLGCAAETRQAMLLLGVVPEKELKQHEGNERVNVKKSDHPFASWRNEFSRWKNRLEQGRCTINAELVKEDTRELYEWLKVLHSETQSTSKQRGTPIAQKTKLHKSVRHLFMTARGFP